MKNTEKIRILDDVIFNLSIYQERVVLMTDYIDQEYFELKDDDEKLYCFYRTEIMFDILLDYITLINEKLTETREMIREWRTTDGEGGGES